MTIISKENGNALRGIFSIVVVCNHLAIRPAGGEVFRFIFSDAGMLAVGVFFFLSGYGLMKQHMSRRDYSKGFLKKRLPAVVIPYLLATILFFFVSILWGAQYDIQGRISAIRAGEPLLPHSWYMLAIILYYIIFAMLMKLFCNSYGKLVLVAFAANTFVVILFMVLGFGNWWYNSGMMFSTGIFAAYKEKEILKAIEYKRWLIAIAVIPCAVYFYFCRMLVFGNARLMPGMPTVLQTFRAFFFLTIVLLLSANFNLKNPVADFLGRYSFEIYLMQGFMLEGLRNEKLYISNDILYIIATIVGTVIIAIPICHISAKLIKIFGKAVK